MEKKRFNILLFSSLFAILSSRTIRLVKVEQETKQLLKTHYESISHEENIVAHRGFSGLEPDNTYESVGRALNTPCVDMIEIDVRLTKDGKIVLHHDSLINIDGVLVRLENLDLDSIDETRIISRIPHNCVQNYLYDDALFLAHRWAEKDWEDREIIRLRDFLEWYSFSKQLIIDVKAMDVNEYYMDELNSFLKDYKDDVFVQSDNYMFLNAMMKKYPQYKYFFIVNSFDDVIKMDDGFDGYTVKQSLLSRVAIKQDKKYLIWTINTSDLYLQLLHNSNYNDSMYIVTDHPDYMCALGSVKKLKGKY